MSTLHRLTHLTLEGFRGFSARWEQVLDADILLVSAPNGHGKSSLMEALTALLTGWSGVAPGERVEALVARNSQGSTLEARGETGDGTLSLAVAWDRNGSVTRGRPATPPTGEKSGDPPHLRHGLPLPDGLPPFVAGFGDTRELAARICAFSQDQVERQFDRAAQGVTLRDVLEPLPPVLERLRERLNGWLRDDRPAIEAMRAQEPQDTERQAARHTLNQTWTRLAPTCTALAEAVSGWPAPLAAIGDPADLLRWFSDLPGVTAGPELDRCADLARDARRAIEGALDGWLRDAERRAEGVTPEGERMARRREEIDDRLAQIAEVQPHLDQALGLFEPAQPGQCDALTLFQTLADNARRWAHAKLPDESGEGLGELLRVRRELGRVVIEDASACAAQLCDWLTPLQRLAEERTRLRKERDELGAALQHLRVSAELDRANTLAKGLGDLWPDFSNALDAACRQEVLFRDWPRRQAQIATLEARSRTIEGLIQALDGESGDNPALTDKLREVVQGVAKRFSLVDGVLPVRLERTQVARTRGSDERALQRRLELRTRDDRTLVQLSTGQKAQMAISLLVGQNLLLSRYLPHRVLLLDDVTTSYDLSNLTREAILWRQLAYGADRDDERYRQVFISSHHEDLTNHLLELLVPPAGRSLYLLRFVDWRPGEGPVIETFRVESTAQADAPRRRRLAQLFNHRQAAPRPGDAP